MTTKAVRSGLILLALCGLAACSSGSNGSAPRAGNHSSDIAANATRYTVTIASVTDADGNVVPMESSSVLSQLKSIDMAAVSTESVTAEDGSLSERTVIDLRDARGSIVKFHSTDMVTATAEGAFAATADLATAEGAITQMLVHVEDGRALNVVLAFGAAQDDGSQDQAKQDQAKQDEAKQDEAKQDEPKQDQPKQDQPKQDEPKQDQPKQDQPKQDQPKQDQPKQDQPKQDQPKQDQPKQDQPKQDQPKQDQPKQDQPKQDQPKQDQPKQDQPKQDQPKQDQPKQDQPKQDTGKQG
jgi:hypothetical protein